MGIYVWNANRTHGVCQETLAAFITRESEREPKEFHVYRAKQQIDFQQIIKNLERLVGLPYNFSFKTSDNSFYCADLIARSFPGGYFKPRPMQFVGTHWNDYYQKLGQPIPEGQSGFHPADMLAHPDIRFVGLLSSPIFQ